jgi:hypothetical protein
VQISLGDRFVSEFTNGAMGFQKVYGWVHDMPVSIRGKGDRSAAPGVSLQV